MLQDPRRLSFLLLPAIVAVSAVSAVLAGSGSVNLDASLQTDPPNLAYVDDSDPSDGPQDTDSEQALPSLTVPLAPTTTGPPPSMGVASPGVPTLGGAPSTAAPTPTSGPGTTGGPITNPPTTAGATPATPTAPPSAPTTKAPGTAPPPTAAPTTKPPTTTAKPPATNPPTTKPPTTAAPTTQPPTTQPPTTQPTPSGVPIIGVLIEGESTSDPNGGWNNYPADVASNLGTSVAVKVDGQNGVRADQINAEGSKAHLLTTGSGQNVAVLWIGINDISQGRQPTEVYSQISTWASNRRNEGWDRIVLITVTKFEHPNSLQSFSWGSHEVADQKRQELNNLIAGNSAGADSIVDLRNAEGIGDGYSVHDTNWRPDKVHLSTLGNERVAGYVSAAIQSLGS